MDLTREPFRWDQRLYSLVLRVSADAANVPVDCSLTVDAPSPIG
jgi:hypothetical protein